MAVLYQIYPRSFKDSNGDGVGDLRGIAENLDYIKTVADAVWLSPIYASPLKDFGYDASSFVDVHDEYGTLRDFDDLVTKAHERGIKIMMDLTPNHTSDQHEWFKEARSSRDNPKRDWYVWCDEPNNWISLAGGSSWKLDEVTGQYYLHSWLPSQPDLNWQNPEVREAIADVMRFWFDRGVDGFRVDAVWVVAKDENYADDIQNYGTSGKNYGDYQHIHCRNGAKLNDYMKFISDVAAEYDDRYVILEYYPTYEFGDANEQLYSLQSIAPHNMTTFFFDAMRWPFEAKVMGDGVARYLAGLTEGATPVFTFGNHDQSRIVTQFGGDKQARMIALMQLTLPGLPCVYYGEELGMENYPDIKTLKDEFAKEGMMGGRDVERTPMQWSGRKYADFSDAKPWLPVHDNHVDRNVEFQTADHNSFLALYRKLVNLRREQSVLRRGNFKMLGYDNDILCYEMSDKNKCYRILMNFSQHQQSIAPETKTIVSSLRGEIRSGQELTESLEPLEAILVERPN